MTEAVLAAPEHANTCAAYVSKLVRQPDHIQGMFAEMSFIRASPGLHTKRLYAAVQQLCRLALCLGICQSRREVPVTSLICYHTIIAVLPLGSTPQ